MNMNEYILHAELKPIVQTHTVWTTQVQVDKNRQNRTFYKDVAVGS